MKLRWQLALVLMAAAGNWLQPLLWAGDKKGPEKKDEPPKEVVVNDQLTTADVKDKVRQQMYCKTYTYKMIEGRSYQIDMKSKDFDSYLRLENPEGVQVAFDDDSGGFPDARIIYRAPKGGDYTIICTSFGAGSTGKFTLIVKDLTGGSVPKGEKKENLPPPKKTSLISRPSLGKTVPRSDYSMQNPRKGRDGAAVAIRVGH